MGSETTEYLTTTKAVRKALAKCTNVYVAIMMGNMTWAARITKDQARAILTDVDNNWANCEELGVHAIGYVDGQDLHLGGL